MPLSYHYAKQSKTWQEQTRWRVSNRVRQLLRALGHSQEKLDEVDSILAKDAVKRPPGGRED